MYIYAITTGSDLFMGASRTSIGFTKETFLVGDESPGLVVFDDVN